MKKKTIRPVTRGAAKVPVVIQMEALECGAACLTMILAYYKRWIPLEILREDCGVSRDGSKAKNILLAARKYGMTANGYRLEIDDLKNHGPFPCIIHWNMNHFVVLRGFRRGKVLINDPARGRITVSMEEFNTSYTGICLMFEPGENFEPGGKPVSMLSFVRKRLKGARAAVIFVMLTSVIASAFSLIQPVTSRIFIDRLLSGKDPEWLPAFTVAMIVIAVLRLTVDAVRTIYALRINGKMDMVGTSACMWKLLKLPVNFYSQRMVGDIQYRKETNGSINSVLVETLAPLALETIMMVLYLILMLRYSVLLTAVGVGAMLVNLLISRIISKQRMDLTRVEMRDNARLASMTVNGIQMIESLKAGGAEDGYFRRWSGAQAAVNKLKMGHVRLDSVLGAVPSLLSAIADHMVLVLGVFLIMNDHFTLGMIMTFQGFLTEFLSPAETLITAGETIQEMRSQMERVEDVMQYPDDPLVSGQPDLDGDSFRKLRGLIEMKNVTFGYSPLEKPLIENFSLTIQPESHVALVGFSGCGKSTLAKLLSGLVLPWSGEILFDGKPIQEIDRGVFKSSLSVVDQEITLFEDTISNNIKMWDDSVENFEQILAARDAQIHDEILQRPGGYRYRMSEGGREFSGGQRQRIEIARALAQDPTIMILDEATSALDAQTEYKTVQAIKGRGMTCVVVAHRLSTIRDCDQIIVLDNGHIAEQGTHEELVALGGLYTRLVTSE